MKFQVFLLFLMLTCFAGLIGPDLVAQFGADPSQFKAAPQDDVEVIEAKVGDRFHIQLIQAARKRVKSGEMTRREFLKLRKAMISPAFRKQVKELAVIQMASTGEIDKIPTDADGKIDWDKLGDFLERMLPLILDFLDALFDIIGKLAQSGEYFSPVGAA